MEKKSYKAKVEIIRQGQDGTQMFILEKGVVNVSKVNCLNSKFASYKYDPTWYCRTLFENKLWACEIRFFFWKIVTLFSDNSKVEMIYRSDDELVREIWFCYQPTHLPMLTALKTASNLRQSHFNTSLLVIEEYLPAPWEVIHFYGSPNHIRGGEINSHCASRYNQYVTQTGGSAVPTWAHTVGAFYGPKKLWESCKKGPLHKKS